MIAVQLAFRAWAVYPSWFYTDDYRLLADATGHHLSWAYLARPFDSQFMPVGRAIAWVVAQSGHVNWALAATVTVCAQLLASLTCLWMLSTLFGRRWGILPPLGIYLFSAITMPALMWWAASLNQLPLQIVYFAAVTTWVRYLRTRTTRWLLATLAVLAIGLLCYVKTILVLPVLAFLMLGYFAGGRPLARVWAAVKTYWVAELSVVILGGTFAAYYLTQVPQIFEQGDKPVAGDLGDSMIGTSLSTGAIGGPWRWATYNPPTGYADPPLWTVHMAWVLLVLFGLTCALLRHRTGRAWVLLAVYVGAVYVLLLTSRAQVAGASIGYEYRYLTDVMPVLTLCMGLVTMPLIGSLESSAERAAPFLTLPVPRLLSVTVIAAVCSSGLISSWSYARIWHEDNPGASYVHTARDGLRGQGTVDLADQIVPAAVIPGFSSPYNTTGRLLPLVVDNVRFPDVTSRLAVLGDDGTPRTALIDAAVTSLPGPDRDCGWKLDRGSITIPLNGRTLDYTWWVRIGYLSSKDDTMEVHMHGDVAEVPVLRGLNSVFLRTTGEIGAVTLNGLEPGTTMCVDTVEVGQPVPGKPL